MNDYIIITDSTADLPKDYVNENQLEVLPMQFRLNDKDYLNYPDHHELSIKDFYDQLRSGHVAKTNQLNVQTFFDVFRKYVQKGLDVLAICFSSGLSGTCNSAMLAKNLILEEYPEATVCVVDSLCASMGEGLLVHHAVMNKKAGMSLEENYQAIDQLRHDVSHWFTVDDIDTLRRGGRVSASKAFIAKTLKIKPVLYVSPDGHLIPRLKKIGRKAALSCLVDKVEEMIDLERTKIIFISHGHALEDALKVKQEVEKRIGFKNFMIGEIGPVIGAHSGPGTIAIFFISKGR